MHSSIILTSLFAALAVAKPMQHLAKHIKKEYVTDMDVVVETVFVTVTSANQAPAETPEAEAETVVVMNTVYAKPAPPASTRAAAYVAPKPKTRSRRPSSPAVATPVASSEPAPVVVPSSSAAPAVVVPTTTAAPVVVPTTTAAPVVVVPTTSDDPAPATSAAPAADSSYQSTILYRHNAHRANHSASALVYNNTLAGYAKVLADRCKFAHDLTIGGGGYGQNIVQNGRLPWTGVNVASAAAFGITEQWYNGEEPLYASSYSKDNPQTSADVLHFTQMVWKETTDVGCYTSQCAQGTVDPRAPTAFTVCNYWPQGNYGGEYGDNVAAPLGNPTIRATIQWSP